MHLDMEREDAPTVKPKKCNSCLQRKCLSRQCLAMLNTDCTVDET